MIDGKDASNRWKLREKRNVFAVENKYVSYRLYENVMSVNYGVKHKNGYRELNF